MWTRIGDNDPVCLDTCYDQTCSSNEGCFETSPGSTTGICYPEECSFQSDCPAGTCALGSCVRECTPKSGCQLELAGCWPASVFDWVPVDVCAEFCGEGMAGCSPGFSCKEGRCEPIGDPAFVVVLPVEQFRDRYVFLTPSAYLKDYVTVVAPADASVVLDGAPIVPLATATVAGFTVVRAALSDGVHKLSADQPIGATVYGYDDDVSYAYPAGAAIRDLSDQSKK